MKEANHPRLAFWLTVIPAALAAALSVYHLFLTAATLADPDYGAMLSGFSGSLFVIFDILMMSLPISLLLLCALLLNLFWSRRLARAWSLSAIAAMAVDLTCGVLLLMGINSGILAVSLNLAARAIAQSLTAVTLVYSLTRK